MNCKLLAVELALTELDWTLAKDRARKVELHHVMFYLEQLIREQRDEKI